MDNLTSKDYIFGIVFLLIFFIAFLTLTNPIKNKRIEQSINKATVEQKVGIDKQVFPCETAKKLSRYIK